MTSLAYGWEHASELVGKEPSEGPSDAAKEGGLRWDRELLRQIIDHT